MMTKKVIQIMPEFGLAGAEKMVESLSVALYKDDYQISVVSLYDYYSAITDNLDNKKISIDYLSKKRGLDLKIIYKLYNIFKKERPDIVHTHRYVLPYVLPAAKLSGVKKNVHTIHNVAEKEVGSLQRKINSLFYRHFNVIPVSISPLVKESVLREYRLLENQSPLIYNGIDLDNCIQKDKYHSENGIINILHIGRFSEQKNHIDLLRSFKIVHENAPYTKLKLIGEGKLENEIKIKVKELGLDNSVEFLGVKPNVYPYLNEADLFVLPSQWEGMPITLIEAMATGLPIVATNVGGIPDMIEDNSTGLLVGLDIVNIAEAILKLVKNEGLRKRLGNSALIASKQFSVEKMKEHYKEIYEERW